MEGDRMPRIVGVLNVTPDSFSDGGRHEGAAAQVAAAERLAQGGADCIEIGGESTRPGAPPVAPEEELRRVTAAMEALAGRVDAPLAVDTSKAAVARAALARGAVMINDVTALRGDPRIVSLICCAPSALCPVPQADFRTHWWLFAVEGVVEGRRLVRG